MARKAKANKAPKITQRLRRRLVLNRWAFHVLGVPLDVPDPIKRLRDLLGGDEHRGIVDGHTRYCRAIQHNLFAGMHISADQLDLYDSNIVALTRRLFPPEKTREVFEWTWFQYLCLLLTEVYLDRYFSDREGLKNDLNIFVKQFNEEREDLIPEYTVDELNKLAFQNATGSGKTHLMHANILQFRHYAERAGVLRKVKNTILITPNEGLSRQHVEKFPDYVFAANMFQKEHLPVFMAGKIPVQVMDYHDFAKPSGKEGPKTVHPDRFENCNLVMVDEGHRGAKGSETGLWKQRRDDLAEDGFAFEYSATFSQAIDSAADNNLKNEYAKGVLFDFSYGEFYKDGYGKEYRILNIEDRPEARKAKKGKTRKVDPDAEFPYLVGALLAFYQQVRHFDENRAALSSFNIERPLMVLVGASVTAGDITAGELSDVQELLTFFGEVLKRSEDVERIIKTIMDGDAILTDESGTDAFAGVFDWLKLKGLKPKDVYNDLKQRLFHSTEHTLKVTYVTSNGEIRLAVGQAEKPFAIINVGADGAQKVAKVCEENLKLVVERDQTGSEALFPRINKLDHVHVLIGSRKFTEGWDSWRVSSMGLLNLGKGEGTQVIQLFGRGVRLKGQRVRDADGNEKGYSLKRSTAWIQSGRAPANINVVETLNVFGVHAKYMATFREMLANEGADVGRKRTWEIPVIEVFRDKGIYERLKVPIVPHGERGFRKAVKIPVLADYEARRNLLGTVELSWFPKVESAVSRGARSKAEDHAPTPCRIPDEALAFMNWDRLYFDVQRLKYEVGHNLRIGPSDVRDIFSDHGWYTLQMPKQDRAFRFDALRMWEDIASQLLQKLFRKLYDTRRGEYDTKHRKYVTLKEATAAGAEYEGVFPTWLITMTDDLAEDLGEENLKLLTALAEAAREGKLAKFKLPAFLKEVPFDRHLYRPLLIKKGLGQVVVSPVALDENEAKFVEDVEKATQTGGVLAEHEVYLLRNQSRGKGIGFVEGGNFYPDFLLWIVMKDSQHIVFLDPHGMGREGKDSLKVAFHKKIKEIEQQLQANGQPQVFMHSYLLSTTETTAHEPEWMKEKSDSELMEVGVARLRAADYLKSVLQDVLAAPAVS